MLSKIVFAMTLSALTFGIASGDVLVKTGEKVAFLGDSITEQGWNMPGGYVRLTVAGLETLGAKVVPVLAGVSGNTSRDMLARLDRDVLSKKPDWMTLSCGVNDVWHGAGGCTLAEYQKNITSIVDRAQAAGIKVLILTSTPIGEDDNANNKKLAAYNDFLHQLAAQRHLPVAEENAAFHDAIAKAAGQPSPALTQDGVHPQSDGSVIMARALLTAFGASPAQLDQVQTAWMDRPASAFASARFNVDIADNLTLKQYLALKAVALSRKLTVRQLVDSLIVPALGDAIEKHRDDAVMNLGQIQQETQVAVYAKIAELTK